MRPFLFSSVMIAALLSAGCSATVGVRRPDLVYVAPGVEVIADYDEPIFYADSFYWRFDGAAWYRSSYYTGGWAYAPPPPAVRRIERPHEYVHYRPSGWVARREPAQPAPVVREHRDDRPAYEPRRVEPSRPPEPPPAVPSRRVVPPPGQVPPPQAAPQPGPAPRRRVAPPPRGAPRPHES